MNRQAARKRADEGDISIGDLRQMISSKRGVGGMSTVNAAFEMEDILDIYEKALEGREDNEVPEVWRRDPYSRTGAMKRTRDHLQIQNILRDCA